jgi:ElaB/YqjD/DUF883 family membrane-anchored ribosome-binding protein
MFILVSIFFLSIADNFVVAKDMKNSKEDNSLPKKNDEMNDDLDDLNNELKPEPIPEEKDILSILKQIQEKMIDSADSISKISLWKAIEDSNTAKSKIDELIKRQKEALEALNNSLQQTKKKQSEAIDNITKLIKIARQIQQSQGQGQPEQPKAKNPEIKPKEKPEPDQRDQNQSNPAKKPYEATSLSPGVGKHIGGLVEKWGNLPPKIREAIILSKPDDFTLEYKQWLERYFKILAEESK